MAKKESNLVLIGGVVLLVILIALFWPKVSQLYDDGFTASAAGKTYYKNMACSCLGLEVRENNCKSCTQKVDCYGFVSSCQYQCKSNIDGIWQTVDCNPAKIQVPANQGACESSGGTWGPVGFSEVPICVMLTYDGGKECSDSSECQATCEAELVEEDYDNLAKGIPVYKKGRCTSSTSPVGCHTYVVNGKVGQMLCVD